MAFHSTRFPERIAFGAQFGLLGQTEVITIRSGEEKRNAAWSVRRRRYDVSHAVKTQDDADELRAHFEAVDAMADVFPFKDWSDYEVTITEGVAIALTSTTFRLQKKYVSGSRTTLRDIRLPSPTSLLSSGSPVTYSVSSTTGIVTIASAPAAGTLTWAGEFDVLARYGSDELHYTVENKNQSIGLLYSFQAIPILEVINE